MNLLLVLEVSINIAKRLMDIRVIFIMKRMKYLLLLLQRKALLQEEYLRININDYILLGHNILIVYRI